MPDVVRPCEMKAKSSREIGHGRGVDIVSKMDKQ